MAVPATVTETPFAREIKMLLQVALLSFIFTVVIGILNGTDLVDFDGAQGRRTLLTHVHGGTIGWITLSVFAASLWLFGGGRISKREITVGRWLAYGAAAGVVIYLLVFLTTFNIVRPIGGAVVAAVFIAFLGWTAMRARGMELTVPHLGILAAVASSGIGAVLGVLWGIQIATGRQIFIEGGEGAHPAMMIVGFLVPVGMALSEWAFRRERLSSPGRMGVLQIALPFIGGLSLMAGILADLLPLIMLGLPFEIVAAGIYLWRMWPDLRAVDWRHGSVERFAALSSISLVINIGYLGWLISKYADDFEATPPGQVLVLDHLMFIGVMTNAIFALTAIASSARRELWPWADGVVLVAINVGLAGFIVGLLSDEAIWKQTFTPILGGAILLGILVYTLRLRSTASATPAEATR